MAEQNQIKGEILMEWTFPEFVRHERSRGWYIAYIVFTLAMFALALRIENYTFFAVLFLASLILLIRLRRTPPDIHFAIREEGVEVGSGFYPWREFKDFWIIYRPPEVKKVYLHFTSSIRPDLDVALESQNPLVVRQFLNEHLIENKAKEEEPLSDQLTRFFKI